MNKFCVIKYIEINTTIIIPLIMILTAPYNKNMPSSALFTASSAADVTGADGCSGGCTNKWGSLFGGK